MTECQHPHLDGMEYKDGHKREECSQCGKVWSTRNGDRLMSGQHGQEYCPDLQAMNPGPGPWMKPWPCPSCIKEKPTLARCKHADDGTKCSDQSHHIEDEKAVEDGPN